jgi:replicative DNA helicase
LDSNQPPKPAPVNGEIAGTPQPTPGQPPDDAWSLSRAPVGGQVFSPAQPAQPAAGSPGVPPIPGVIAQPAADTPGQAAGPGAPPAASVGAPADEPEAAELDWKVETDTTTIVPQSTLDVLNSLSAKVSSGAIGEYQSLPLGFNPLDRALGGGLRVGEMLLIGGAQGTGKTTLALQMARNIALGGQATVLYLCFEHDEEYLLNRMVAMESVLSGPMPPTNGIRIGEVRREILGTWMAQGADQPPDLGANPRLRPALEHISRYGRTLFLMRGSQTASTLENMRRLVEEYQAVDSGRQLVVFVDYLQKVPVIPEPPSETEKVTIVVNGLKDLALSLGVPLVSIVAADKEGLKAARLRNHHLRGSSAINYEADIILILNEKYNIVAKANIEFNPYQAQRFRDWIVLTVEKNRAGAHSIDFEFEKHFEFSAFDPNGRQVQEKLIEERLYND